MKKVLIIIGKILMWLFVILVLLFAAMMCFVIWTEDYNPASEIAEDVKGKLKREPLIIQKALRGEEDAQTRLSECFMEGKFGCHQNHIKAKKWAEKAAAQGSSRALRVLGYIYYMGLDGLPDYQKAFNTFIELSHHYHGPREYDVMLGLMFEKGQFVDKNTEEAISYFVHSNTDCGYMMAGNLYWEGNGIKKDPYKAFENWKESLGRNDYYHQCENMPISFDKEFKKFEQNLKQAEEEGHEDASVIIAQKAIKEKKLTADMIQRLEKLSDTGNGNGEAQFVVGDAYYRGVNIDKDMEKAFKYFKLSYENEDRHFCANTALANMYYRGAGVKKDIRKAKKLWEEGDECQGREDYPEYNIYSVEAFENEMDLLKKNNDADALYQKATTCCQHSINKSDKLVWYSDYDEEGRFWFLKEAAERGHAQAQFELGKMYFDEYNQCPGYSIPDINGDGGGIDKKQGLKWFVAAAKQGHLDAMYRAGDAFLRTHSKNDFKEAEKWFLKAARSGEKRSAAKLADMYLHGIGVEPNYEKSMYWAKQAIKLGYPDANYYLGKMYYEGKGVKQNYDLAFKYLNKATEGYYEMRWAEDILSEMYFYGRGTKRNLEKAKELESSYCHSCKVERFYDDEDYKTAEYEKLWRAATENDDIKAQMELGRRYRLGLIDEKYSIKKAVEWFSRAAFHKEGSTEAKEKLEEAKKLLSEEVTPTWKRAVFENDFKSQLLLGEEAWEQAAEFYKETHEMKNLLGEEAFEWISRSAYGGNVESQYMLAELYSKGGLYIDPIEYYSYTKYPKQHKWLQLSAKQGYHKAQVILGDEYYEGLFFSDSGMGRGWYWYDVYIPRDYKKAFEWYKKATDQKDPLGQIKLGTMYAKGQYVKKNFSIAKKLYEDSYSQGIIKAKHQLGELYLDKDFKEYNPQKTVEIFKELAEAGAIPAMMDLGNLYYDGKHVKKDLKEARKWYAMATAAGEYQAQNKLAEIYENKDFEEYDPDLAKRIKEKARGAHLSYILRQIGIDPAKVIETARNTYDEE